MKNIHVLPTGETIAGIKTKKIYITSDEEIKIGDYYLCKLSMKPLKCTGDEYFNNVDEKKIILTTDQDLIKDGVQAIDDEFLEWFVKNPSCDFVMTIPDVRGLRDIFQPTGKDLYKIIIPKEEPNQVGIDWSGFPKSTQEKVGYVEPKQETLEEAERNYAIKKRERKHLSNREFDLCQKDFIVGAKWQQERMYSEEEVKKLIELHSDFIDSKIDYEGINNATTAISNPEWNDEEWFEQFKKK